MGEHGISAGGGAKILNKSDSQRSFPVVPGELCLAHAGSQYKEQAETRLANLGLLAVAQGFDPPNVKCIVDVDLDDLPELPHDHKEYQRRHETRIKVKTQNRANAIKRHTLRMEAWTELYSLLSISAEPNAPVLWRAMK